MSEQIYLGDGPLVVPGARQKVFLPIIYGGDKVEPKPPSNRPITPAEEFYDLLIQDTRQEHPHLIWCPSLLLAAEWRARGLVGGDPFLHHDTFGEWANSYARRARCRLPDSYPDDGNNIESLGAGTANAGVMFNALANSPSHNAHLFGRGDFFREQRHIGIYMATGGIYGFYWVIHIGICREMPDLG